MPAKTRDQRPVRGLDPRLNSQQRVAHNRDRSVTPIRIKKSRPKVKNLSRSEARTEARAAHTCGTTIFNSPDPPQHGTKSLRGDRMLCKNVKKTSQKNPLDFHERSICVPDIELRGLIESNDENDAIRKNPCDFP